MNNLVLRGITGLFFVASLILPIIFDWKIALLVFSLYFILSVIEFASIFKNHATIKLNRIAFFLVAVVAFALVNLSLFKDIPLILIAPLIFVALVVELWRKTENPIINLGVFSFGLIYLLLPFSLLSFFLKSVDNYWYLLGMFVLIWTNDTFAYLTGRFIGKTKLFERISPKKTWEGTLGGVFFTILVAILIAEFTLTGSGLFWIVSACLIAPSAIVGDLLESLMKRDLGIKDSGNILPGHGGILDRFDATIFTIPMYISWYFMFLAYFK
jgi:phosphatidate cytidylyltransferase